VPLIEDEFAITQATANGIFAFQVIEREVSCFSWDFLPTNLVARDQ
jgi:hypothetical protein